jgi:hypothetical protein
VTVRPRMCAMQSIANPCLEEHGMKLERSAKIFYICGRLHYAMSLWPYIYIYIYICSSYYLQDNYKNSCKLVQLIYLECHVIICNSFVGWRCTYRLFFIIKFNGFGSLVIFFLFFNRSYIIRKESPP